MIRSNYTNNKAESLTANPNSNLEIILPRSTYYHGETIIGILHLKTQITPPTKIKLLFLGKCRIDSRWYNTKNVINFYGVHPVLQILSPKEREIITSDDTICFYATNIIECDVNDKYCIFGSNISCDLPHSATFTSCKYYYNIIALYEDNASVVHTSLSFVIQSSISSIHHTPNVIRTYDKSSEYLKTIVQSGGAAARLKIGTCFSLPSSILDIDHNTIISSNNERRNTQDTKTMRISNDESIPYCILTILNSNRMYPGSTMELQFQLQSMPSNIKQIITFLKGIEYTFYDDCISKCQKTKTYILDSMVRTVNSEYMDFVGITLCLPIMDCPYSICTDLVEVSIFCTVELVLNENNSTNLAADDEEKIEKKISFQFPVYVVHHTKSFQEDIEEDELVLDLVDDYCDDYGLLLDETVNGNNSVEEVNIEDKVTFNDLMILGSYLEENDLR